MKEENQKPAFIYYDRTKNYKVIADAVLKLDPIRVTCIEGELSIATDFPDDIDPTIQMIFESVSCLEFQQFFDTYLRYKGVAGVELRFRDGEWYDCLHTQLEMEELVDDICKDIPLVLDKFDPSLSLADMLRLFPQYDSQDYKRDLSYCAAALYYTHTRDDILAQIDALATLLLGRMIDAGNDMATMQAASEFRNGILLGQRIEMMRQKALAAKSSQASEPYEEDEEDNLDEIEWAECEEEDFDETEWRQCEPDITDLEDLERRYYEGEITLDELLESGEYELHTDLF